MSNEIPGWWSMLLASIGIAGLYLTTRPEPARWYGFIVGLAVQALWIVYAVTTHQLGFVVSAIAYGLVNMIGIAKWLRPRHSCPSLEGRPERAGLDSLQVPAARLSESGLEPRDFDD